MNTTITSESRDAIFKSISSRLVKEPSLYDVLVATCTQLTQELNLDCWSFGSLGSGGRSLKFHYWCQGGDWDGHIDVQSRRLYLDGSSTSSAAQFAMAEKRPIVIDNLSAEDRFDDALLATMRVGSGIVAPIMYSGEPSGVLAVYSGLPRSYSSEDVQFIDSVCQLVSGPIAHEHLENELAEADLLFDTTVNSMAIYLLLLDSDGRILTVNRKVSESLGFTQDDLRDLPMSDSLLVESSHPLFAEALIKLEDSKTQIEEWVGGVRTKDGDERMVHWTVGRMPGGKGGAFTLVATGIETDQDAPRSSLLAESELAEVEAAAMGLPAPDRRRRSERRAVPRRPYPYIQLIAPLLDTDDVPPSQAFFEIRCRDISPDGFSYISYEQPSFSRLVVSFGSAPSQILVAARIVHVTPLPEVGAKALVVGCDYIGRVDNDTADRNAASQLDNHLASRGT